MKKFGKPTGVGLGKANENVGLFSVGAPVGARRTLGAAGLGSGGAAGGSAGADGRFGAGLLPVPAKLLLWLLERPFLPWRFPFLCCLGAEPVVVVDWVVEFVEDVEEEEVVVVEELGVQDCDMETIGPLTGSEEGETEPPGGTVTVKVNFWPVESVTVTTH